MATTVPKARRFLLLFLSKIGLFVYFPIRPGVPYQHENAIKSKLMICMSWSHAVLSIILIVRKITK